MYSKIPFLHQSVETDEPSDVSHRVIRSGLGTLTLLLIIAVDPVLAQDNVVCDAEGLPGMISGFFQITTALGLMGLVVVWQVDSLVEMFTMNLEQKKNLKMHKRTALKSAVILMILGPLYTVAGATMGLPLAECVNLVPW
ncbi:hypothetical protein [Natrinema ejinorense]|uniref:hypothetical protein n=1 Tax=Natrinema ejinorense TaxID=373386 RepID=UPI001FE9F3D6|nr:hypothetical protein [Natrinema ejinorense]